MARLVVELGRDLEWLLYALAGRVGGFGALAGFRCKAELVRSRQRPPYWAAGDVVYVRLRVRCCPRGSSRGCIVYNLEGGAEGEVDEARLRSERVRLAEIVSRLNLVLEVLERLGGRLEPVPVASMGTNGLEEGVPSGHPGPAPVPAGATRVDGGAAVGHPDRSSNGAGEGHPGSRVLIESGRGG